MKRPLVMVFTGLLLWTVAGSAFATGQQLERPSSPGQTIRERYNVDHARDTSARHERAERTNTAPLREYRATPMPVQGGR